jgi:hypothetical protein
MFHLGHLRTLCVEFEPSRMWTHNTDSHKPLMHTHAHSQALLPTPLMSLHPCSSVLSRPPPLGYPQLPFHERLFWREHSAQLHWLASEPGDPGAERLWLCWKYVRRGVMFAGCWVLSPRGAVACRTAASVCVWGGGIFPSPVHAHPLAALHRVCRHPQPHWPPFDVHNVHRSPTQFVPPLVLQVCLPPCHVCPTWSTLTSPTTR